jgi:hypothetical protein
MTRPNLLTRLLLRCSRPFREGHLLHADGTPYMERFALFETPWISARIHHIASPDLDRDMHDHPWNFASLVLSGGYTEARPTFPRHPQWIDGLEDRSYARREAGTVQQLSDMYQDATRWRLFQEWAAAEQRAEDAESALAESGRRNVDMINRRVPIEQVLRCREREVSNGRGLPKPRHAPRESRRMSRRRDWGRWIRLDVAHHYLSVDKRWFRERAAARARRRALEASTRDPSR